MDQVPIERYGASPTWPRLLLAVMTLLGVFKGRSLDASRPCYDCRHKRVDGSNSTSKVDTTSNEELEGDEYRHVENNEEADSGRYGIKCAVCSSLLWNADGKITKDYSKAVPGWLNSRVCGVLSNLLILMFLVCTTFSMVRYMVTYWGQVKHIIHLASYLSFGDIIVGVAMVCTLSNAVQYFGWPGPATDWSWQAVLHQDYILRRLRCLTGRKFTLPKKVFLIFSMVWLLSNSTMQVVLLWEAIKPVNGLIPSNSSFTSLGSPLISLEQGKHTLMFKIFLANMIFVEIVGLLIYTLFWYNILVMREALAAELNLVIVFIRRYRGRLDLCRRRVVEVNHDFRILHGLLAKLMPFIVASSVLGLTVHVSWNYQIYSGVAGTDKGIASKNLKINIFIFSVKLMVLILPVLAVGGINIDFIWLQFDYALKRQRNSLHEVFWDRLLAFTTELQEERKAGHNLMLFLSLISLYLGHNMSEQQLDYRGGAL